MQCVKDHNRYSAGSVEGPEKGVEPSLMSMCKVARAYESKAVSDKYEPELDRHAEVHEKLLNTYLVFKNRIPR